MKVSYTIVSDTVTPDIRARLARVQNPEPALRRMGKILADWAMDAFTVPALRPAPWAPLTKRTLAKKAKEGHGSKPLIASGKLSRTPRVVSVSRTEVVVGSDAETKEGSGISLAAIHQLGAPKRKIPARPFFPFQNGQTMPAARQQIADVLRRWLNAGR
ncbi:MAG: phage virion morphogenesis protein [Kiritimatiellae bacterium]|nr:phage virion morphogenesis protein [Kiritimatiellia bacterium]